MRCCAYSASVNRALYLPKGESGQSETAIQHFDDKLFHINEETMKVRSGRQTNDDISELILLGFILKQTSLGKKLSVKRQAAVSLCDPPSLFLRADPLFSSACRCARS